MNPTFIVLVSCLLFGTAFGDDDDTPDEVDETELNCAIAVVGKCFGPIMESYQEMAGLEGEQLVRKIQSQNLADDCRNTKKVLTCAKRKLRSSDEDCSGVDRNKLKIMREFIYGEAVAVRYMCDTEYLTFNRSLQCMLSDEKIGTIFMTISQCKANNPEGGETECQGIKRRMNCAVNTIKENCGNEEKTAVAWKKLGQLMLDPVIKAGRQLAPQYAKEWDVLDACKLYESRTFRALLASLKF